MPTPPLIYNLFPRLAGQLANWSAHAERAHALGFNWLFVNPVQYPGFSGSLYAIKDHYRLNPLLVGPEPDDPIDTLRLTIERIQSLGLEVMFDLVINHTSKDSPLIKEHPSWFRRDREGYVVSPSAIDPADARNVTVWGDLAEVDNAKSDDRAGLWAYWTAMVQFFLDLGVNGFRCDAAYQVPAALWKQLIGAARKRHANVVFVAETLGCRLSEARTLGSCGFDYLCNSSKWWNFDEPWCLDQHDEFGEVAPSISFAESHDTARLMADSGGLVQVQKQRHAFAAAFSAGLLMPIGYEFCFRRKLDVVSTTPEDWETTGDDISDFVAEVNRLKLQTPLMAIEGKWELVTSLTEPTVVLCKRDPHNGSAAMFVVINKDWTHQQTITLPELQRYSSVPPKMVRLFQPGARPAALPLTPIVLEPAEVIYLLP